MMDMLLAHSARDGAAPQTYEDHVEGVYRKACAYGAETGQHGAKASETLRAILEESARYHDLGKLDDENQAALHIRNSEKRHLPINHVDAGCAALIARNELYAALMIYAHHKGLPNFASELHRGKDIFRDEDSQTRAHTDETLEKLLRRHGALFPPGPPQVTKVYEGSQNMLFRIALSCLADADHTDTAVAYGQIPDGENLPTLRGQERLAALDNYVAGLGREDPRSRLRRKMYDACRSAKIQGGFCVCDSPVGSGKTTAVMAHLLRQAIERKARRIFVVLPYTSIIRQSVEVYRKALVLPGENPEEVVAELHSRGDYQSFETRYLTSLWRAPIIVTTSVAFFETLSSNRPAALRRLHELPGSVLFIDEAHNALPIKLLPLAWRWMNVLAEEWNCYWVLASGSLVQYWTLECFSSVDMPRPEVPQLVRDNLRKQLMAYEHDRVTFCYREAPLGRLELVQWVRSTPGPRLLILNTVQSAAVIASDMAKQYGRKAVEHLSTALTPEDRGKTILRVRQRLQDKTDTDWTLVATSCVEAGVDFSFRSGFRELSSLLSLLQAAGRINRHGENPRAEIWSFTLRDDSALRQNRHLADAGAVLRDYFQRNETIGPELSTRSMNDEITRNDHSLHEIRNLLAQDDAMQFQQINEKFQVIDQNTIPAVIDVSLAEAISKGKGTWTALQQKSVSIYQYKAQTWQLKEIARGVYQWTLDYDDFLGYMAGVLKMLGQ